MSSFPEKSNQRPSILQTASRMSGVCFFLTVPVTWALEGAYGSFSLSWLYVLLFYALPIVLIIWIVVAISHIGKHHLSLPWFVTVSVSMSVLWVLGFTYFPKLQALPHERHIAAQENAAIIEVVEDAPILHAAGPVGVHLHSLLSDTFEARSAKSRYFQGFHTISRC
jgi:hypothetical protein